MYLQNNIKYLRKRHSKSQKDLSHAIGMRSQSIIQKYETGQSQPPLDVIVKIAEYFGVSAKDMIFTNLEEGNEAVTSERDSENNLSDQDGLDKHDKRILRLLSEELDRLEELEAHIKRNPALMEAVRRHDVALWRKLKEEE